MLKKIMTLSMLMASLILSGCVLAPQTIALSEQTSVVGKADVPRAALVRVLDERDAQATVLGTRGGRSPKDSTVFSEQPLAQVLTKRLQNTLEQLGFGAASEAEPLKVQLDIQTFHYQCNESLVANECSINIRFMITAIDGNRTFSKPYGSNEVRSLAASPIADYNQKWVNEALDKVWQYMFSDPEFKQFIKVY